MPKRKVDLLVLGSRETVVANTGSPDDEIGIIDAGGVAVNSGRIVQTASSELLERKYIARRKVRIDDELLLPGFIDAHTHLVFDGAREEEFQLRIHGTPYMETLRRKGGIIETVNRTRQASLSDLLQSGMRRLDNALEAGTTTIEVKSGYGLRLYDELKILHAIDELRRRHPCRVIPTFMGAHAVPPEMDSETYTSYVADEMLPEVYRARLAKFCDVFCEQGAFDEKQSTRILRVAGRLGLATKVHADEFTDSKGAFVANKTGSISADHLVHSPPEQLERMTATGVTPVLLPASSQSLLTREYAPARAMLKMGLPVSLATDFSPANWTLSQLTVAATASRELRMGASEIIRSITTNAAKALGLARRTGSLTAGKAADLVSLRVANHKWVGYAHADRLVDKVFIGGKLVVDEGKRLA